MKEDSKKTHEDIILEKGDLEALFEATFDQINSGQGKASESASKTPVFDSSMGGLDFDEKTKLPGSMDAAQIGHSKSQAQTATDITETRLSNNEVRAVVGEAGSEEPTRSKTALRHKYEQEAERIQKEIGSIEDIRSKLGLSKRKMAQLLMIDPSAWTRWVKGQSAVPPHIYRSLQWYMILQEKHPEYKSSLWLNTVAQPSLNPKELEEVKSKLLAEAKTEITKKAINYIIEEDHKRNKLQQSLEQKIEQLKLGRKVLFAFVALQILILMAVFVSSP